MSTWESATDNDLSNYGVTTLECYDSQIHEDRVSLSGATGLGRGHYRRIISSPDCRVPFNGTIYSGARFDCRPTIIDCMRDNEGWSRWENLVVTNTKSSTPAPLFYSATATGYPVYRNCIAYESSGDSGYYSLGGRALFYHCMAIRNEFRGFEFLVNRDATILVICCSAIGQYSANGFSHLQSGGIGGFIYHNCLSQNDSNSYTDDDFWNWNLGGWNCANDDHADSSGSQPYYYNNLNLIDTEIDDKSGLAKPGQTLYFNIGAGQQCGMSPNTYVFQTTSWAGFFPSGEYPYMRWEGRSDPMTDRNETADRTYISRITGQLLDQISGESFRIELEAHSTQDTVILGMTVGNGTFPDYSAGDWTRVYFSGNENITIPAGTKAWSDWTSGEFEVTAPDKLQYRVYMSGENYYTGYGSTNAGNYVDGDVLETENVTADGYIQWIPFVRRIQKSRCESGEVGWNLDIRGAERTTLSGEAWDVGASKSVSSWQYPPYHSSFDSCGILPSGEDADFSSLTTWESATDNDLSSYGKTTLWCFDNLGSGEHVLSTNLSINGATNTTSGEFREIVGSPYCMTPFAGKWGTGANFLWSGESSNQGWNMAEDACQTRDLAFKLWGLNNAAAMTAVSLTGNRSVAVNCVVDSAFNSGTDGAYGFGSSAPASEYTTRINCIAKNCETVGFYTYQFTANVDACVSCTALGCAYGFYSGWGAMIVHNCIAYNSSIQDYKAGSDTASRFSTVSGWNVSDSNNADLYGQAGDDYKNNASGELAEALDSYGLHISGETLNWNGAAGDRAGRNPYNDVTASHNPYYRMVNATVGSGEWWSVRDIIGTMRSEPWTPDSIWLAGASELGGGGGSVQPIVFIITS